jgi:hypothetical protein
MASTNILFKKHNSLSDRRTTLSAVMKRRETLSDFVLRIMREKGISNVKVSKRARALGADLSPAFVQTVIQKSTESPGVQKVKALALGLGEPEDLLFEIARGRQLSDESWFKGSVFATMANEFRRLSDADKRELLPTVEMLKREIERRLPIDED